MKLIYCKKCGDVVRLIHTKWRTCECKESGGQYNDDLITATIYGPCRVFGIPNPWLKECELTFHIRDDARQWFRDTYGPWGNDDIWWGEKPGDEQIIRLVESKDYDNSYGPKLKVKVTKIDNEHTKTEIFDKRNYVIGDGTSPKFIICENQMKPSFKLNMKNIFKKKLGKEKNKK